MKLCTKHWSQYHLKQNFRIELLKLTIKLSCQGRIILITYISIRFFYHLCRPSSLNRLTKSVIIYTALPQIMNGHGGVLVFRRGYESAHASASCIATAPIPGTNKGRKRNNITVNHTTLTRISIAIRAGMVWSGPLFPLPARYVFAHVYNASHRSSTLVLKSSEMMTAKSSLHFL
ncbi:unnamed protein product [Chrysodeixis includens]|uniref:Uncharacterized protein n=1 Tax=Chrysodeixis includens TaxID=689277 RepID=A0A9N8KQI6_CHRIL|nr:unnamed protein product [Chrysodeixis includens]